MTSTLVDNDDLSSIIGEYSMPTLADMGSESLLTQSQYAQVIFHDLLPCYPTDADIWCRYSVTKNVEIRHGDRVALYRVGWSSVHDHIQFEMAPVPRTPPTKPEDFEFQVLFRASTLPKDTSEYYQLCYVNLDSSVCGASIPFQFRQVQEDELCEVEEMEGLLVVRTATAINEDKVRDSLSLIQELEKKKAACERKNEELIQANEALEKKLQDLSSIEKHEERLQKDLHAMDEEKNEVYVKMRHAEEQVQQLNSSIQALSADKTSLTNMLKTESSKNLDIARLRSQLENMQEMLDASTQSKEMATQALHCEQTKVMRLNIEHDKYKFRAEHLDEEKRALEIELLSCKDTQESFRQQIQQNLALLKLKSNENDNLMSKIEELVQKIGCLQLELQQALDSNEVYNTKLNQKENTIVMLNYELRKDLEKNKGYGQLNEDYDNMKCALQILEEENVKVHELAEHNEVLRKQSKQLLEKNENLDLLDTENKRLKLENETLSQEIMQCKTINEYLNFCLDKAKNAQFQGESGDTEPVEPVQIQSSRHAALNAPLAELKAQLASAEESNSSLLLELQQIRDKQNLIVLPTSQTDPNTVNLNLTIQIMELQNKKADLEIQLDETKVKETAMVDRISNINVRLLDIDKERAWATSELNELESKKGHVHRLLADITNAMQTIQREILHEDEAQASEDLGIGRQQRLIRFSGKSNDLENKIAQTTSDMYDIGQNILVLESEQTSLQGDLERTSISAKEIGELKCNLLEDLVTIDHSVIRLKEELFKAKEANQEVVKRKCLDAAKEIVRVTSATEVVERVQVEGQGDSLLSGWEMLEAKRNDDKESDLQLRLDLAAKEYRKIYIDKMKVEKRLEQLQKKHSSSCISNGSIK